MARLLAVLLSALLLIVLNACSGFTMVSGAIHPDTQTVAGMVTIVQFQFVNGSSSLTIVTLAGGGMAQTIPFCGDQRSSFPMDQTVSASFNPGSSCNTLVTVSPM